MFCPKCGAESADNAKFCSNCAFRLAEYETAAPASGEEEDAAFKPIIPDITPIIPDIPVQRNNVPAAPPQGEPVPIIQPGVPYPDNAFIHGGPVQDAQSVQYGQFPAQPLPSKKSHAKLITILIIAAALIGLGIAMLFKFVINKDDDIIGKWHCFKLVSDGAEFYEKNSVDAVSQNIIANNLDAEFRNNGSGDLIFAGEKMAFNWNYTGKDYSVNIQRFDVSGNDLSSDYIGKITAEIKDDIMEMTIYPSETEMSRTSGLSPRTCLFKKNDGGDNPDTSSDISVSQSEANDKARMVYNAVEKVYDTHRSEGFSFYDNHIGYFGPARFDELDVTDAITGNIRAELSFLELTDGYFSWMIDEDSYSVVYAEWRDQPDGGVVGRYPDADINNTPTQNPVYDYAAKSKLKASNSNAKLVFTTITGICSDLTAEGKSYSISRGYFAPTLVSDLREDVPIQNAVKQAMTENDSIDGWVSWKINEDCTVEWAQWSSDYTGIVGQYPDPETDPSVTHTAGEHIVSDTVYE